METRDFELYYESLADDQLLQILADNNDLVPEAVAALDREAKKRGLKQPEPTNWFRRPGSNEQVHYLDDYPESLLSGYFPDNCRNVLHARMMQPVRTGTI